MFFRSIFYLCFLSSLNAIELDSIDVQDEVPNIAYSTIETQNLLNAQTLSQKLYTNANINQIDSSTNANVISIRGNNFRATDFYEDGIPLYRTANGFVDMSLYNDDSLNLDINLGGDNGLYAPSATGGEIILSSKKLQDGVNGYLDISSSTNIDAFNLLSSYKTDNYYVKMVIAGMKQDYFKLSNDFLNTSVQSTDKRVNSDKKQLNGYMKFGYDLDYNSKIAFKFSHLSSEFGLPVNIFDAPSTPFSTNADYNRMEDKKLSSYWFYYDYNKNDISIKLRTYYDDYKDVYNFYDSTDFDELLFPTSTYYDDRLGSIFSLGYDFSDRYSSVFTLNLERNRHKAIDDNDPISKINETNDAYISYLSDYKFSDSFKISSSLKYSIQKLKKAHSFNGGSINYQDNKALDAQITFNYTDKSNRLYYLSVARKNRFASLRELYPFFPWDNALNNVKPESSDNFEVGFQTTIAYDTVIKTSVFYNKIDDMIVYDSGSHKNIETRYIKGFDLNMYDYSIKNNELEISYSYLYTLDKNHNKINNIPKSKLNIMDKIKVTSDLNFIINYMYVSSINDSYNSTIYKLPSYSLSDFQLSYNASKRVNLKLGIKNLFDKSFYNRYGQPGHGRDIFMNLKYIF
jgi:iron complex outermembrane receptor protein